MTGASYKTPGDEESRTVRRSPWKKRPAYDRNHPDQTAPSVVNYDLDQLRVGENEYLKPHPDGYDVLCRDVAPGDGWCRAQYAPECAWPTGAHMCVRVMWYPDYIIGSDWMTRLDTVTTALQSLGYTVEQAGQPADPEQDREAVLLVYLMEPGKTPPARPDDAWAYVPPARQYRWPEVSPQEQLQEELSKAEVSRYCSRWTVWKIESALWPPHASFCVQARWWPDPSAGVHEGARQFVSAVHDLGYRTRLQERPIPSDVEYLDFLIYQEAEPAP
ncbi:hypothetical protein ACIQ6V_32785 [Streptomyces sp. NPDC096198]|uniref:hypothetical protein n=1 Tax=Streptomyces sp. NPDC096198 TaxID=3366080 RepID=UPI003804F04A